MTASIFSRDWRRTTNFGRLVEELKVEEMVDEEEHDAANRNLPKADGGAGATLFMLSAFVIEAIMWGMCFFPLFYHIHKLWKS